MNYAVTTMGALGDDDGGDYGGSMVASYPSLFPSMQGLADNPIDDSGAHFSAYGYPSMEGMGSADDGPAAAEGGFTAGNEDVGHGVGMATANPLSSAPANPNVAPRSSGGPLVAVTPRSPSAPSSGGGGSSSVPSLSLTAPLGSSMFGNLFGENTDVIVLAGGLLLLGGLVYMTLNSKKGAAPARRARR